MAVRKNQTLNTKSAYKNFILLPCVITVQSYFCVEGLCCSSYVAHLFYFKLYVNFSGCLFLVSWPCYCNHLSAPSKKSQQTNQPHHTHLCIAFVYLLMLCLFFLTLCLTIKLLNVGIQHSSDFWYYPMFRVREMIVES